MTEKEKKKTSKSEAQSAPGTKALANVICILTLLFVLGALWQSLGEFL